MRSIVYLASYPRSGNTYVRALLANYEHNLNRPLTTQEIALFGFGEHDEAFLRAATGLSAGRRTIEDAWLGRPAYFDLVRQSAGKGPVLFKTHNLNGSVFGMPAFAFQPGDRIVYIVRHPLDVAVSGAFFFNIEHAQMAARMLLAGATNHSGDAFWEITGSWIEHVAGWLNQTHVPILLVRFEDLRSNPGRQLRRILEFTGKTVTKKRLRRAVAHTAFEHLRASQQADGFYQGPGKDRRATFFRDGRSNQWPTELNPDAAARLSEGLGGLMDVLSYERSAGLTWPSPGDGDGAALTKPQRLDRPLLKGGRARSEFQLG